MDIRSIIAALKRNRITASLVILQVALSCAIVCNAVFLIEQRLQRMDLPSGIAEHELLQIQFAYINERPDADARTRADLAALRRLPGVQAVGLANQLPLSGYAMSNSGLKRRPDQRDNTIEAASYYGQNLLPTLGVQLRAGRDFEPEELLDLKTVLPALHSHTMKALPHTVIVTEAVASRLWPGQAPLGKTLYVGDGIPLQVIGVMSPLARPDALQAGVQYSVVYPIRMTPGEGGSYLIRVRPADRDHVLLAALRLLGQLDADRIVLSRQSYDAVRHQFFEKDRGMAQMLAAMLAAMLTITVLGIAGLASFWVGQRRHVIGIRRALGARRMDVLRYFLTENFVLVSIGIGLGMVLAYGMNLGLMRRYELPRLPWQFFPVGAIALWLIGQLAVLGPALRATRVSPMVATRGG
ncbi:ABC transporter permease [Frateuria aurantia]